MRITLLQMFLLIVGSTYAQELAVTGQVLAKGSNEPLPFATILIKDKSTGTVTDEEGRFILYLSTDNSLSLEVSFVGFQTSSVTISNQLSEVKIFLEPAETVLDNILILDKTIKENTLSLKRMTPLEIRTLPLVFGEIDIVKGIQFEPGVRSIGEGSGALLVRGGRNDQNLILLDGMPIFNSSHLFGFVSAFNPDAIKDFTFIKGVQPAKFGGRLSSVVSVNQKSGNREKYGVQGGISPFAFRTSINGPISKEKSFFQFSARKSLIDLILSPNESLAFVPGFYDVTFKNTTILSDKSNIVSSFYKGSDRIYTDDSFGNSWGNLASTIKYQRNLSDDQFFEFAITQSRYNNTIEFIDTLRVYDWNTQIDDLGFSSNYEKIGPNKRLEIGLVSTVHKAKPGYSSIPNTSLEDALGVESAVYADFIYFPKSAFEIQAGFRLSHFKPLAGVQEDNQISRRGDDVYNIEPRLSVRWDVSDKLNLDFGYGRNVQYLQVIQNNLLSYTNLESWFLANDLLEPQIGDLVSLGGFLNTSGGSALSWSAYYRRMTKQVDYIDNAQIVFNPDIESDLRVGDATAYGFESQYTLTDKRNKLSISYTFSSVLNEIEGINDGEQYPAIQDVPHDIRVVFNRSIGSRILISAFWNYTTGRVFSLPQGYFSFADQNIPIYSSRNSARFPNYHRMDLTLSILPKELKQYKGTFTFGVFNAYGRANPLSYQFNFVDSQFIEPRVTKFHFLRFFPMMTYSFNFKS